MSYWDPFELSALPLSAYTPGQGDPKMEGGWQTASGKPMYTLEAYLRGEAPYVTGATSQKTPSGQLVYRTLGDQQVPVRITDYGPGAKGLDIATTNSKWATNFPYQGATDKFIPPGSGPWAPQQPSPALLSAISRASLAQNDRGALLKDIDNTIFGGGQAPMPTPTPTPTSTPVAADGRPGPLDLGVLGQFAVRNYAPSSVAGVGDSGQPGSAVAGPYQPGSLFRDQYAVGSSGYPVAMALPSTGEQLGGTIASVLGQFGKSMSQQSQQGQQQAMAMLQRRPSAIGMLLDQLAANPTAYLKPIQV